MQHRVHARTDVGKIRERNEDHHHVFQREDGVWILIVCDGMGGHAGGDIASQMAVEAIVEILTPADRAAPAAALRAALIEANRRVTAAPSPDRGLDMGTTAVIAWVDGPRLWYAWVGDSRLYHFRGPARLHVTTDHTRVQVLIELGLLTPAEARHHPESHMLMQAIGGGPAAQHGFNPSVSEAAIPLSEGDLIFLSSDGLHDLVEEPEMLLSVADRSAEAATGALIEAALSAGGHDNVTVALLIAGREAIPALTADQRAWLNSRIERRPPEGPSRLHIGLALVIGTLVGTFIGLGVSKWLRLLW